jgi:hypothetical protein
MTYKDEFNAEYKATVTYKVTFHGVEWNNLYVDHMGITGKNETWSREDIVRRMQDGWMQEFASEVVSAAIAEAQVGNLTGTIYFGYRTDDNGHFQIVAEGDPWWRAPQTNNNDLKLLGTDDWWKEHDTEDESNAAIGRVVFEVKDTGWDYEGWEAN